MKNLRIRVLVLLSLFGMQALYGQASLKRADKQYELSAFNEAVQSYLEVLAKDPEHPEANKKIADCYRHLNKLDKAAKHYQMAVAKGKLEDMYVFQYGLTLQGLGKYDMAKEIFEDLGKRNPSFTLRCKQFADACDFALMPQTSPRYKVTPEYLNRPSSDFGVAFLRKENVVYSSTRDDIRPRNERNAPGSVVKGANKILITQRDRNGFLETPSVLHKGFGTSVNEGPVAYSADGKWVAVTKNNFTEGVRQIPSSGLELSLHIAETDASGDWTNPMPFPHNGSGYSTGFPCFSPDGQALYYASDKPGGYGGFDLYVSYRIGNTWSAPENLGPTVNSLGNEITPFFDGASLYFASDFHKGYGGFDIFRAEESNKRWSTLYHGGPGLNSSYDDYGFIFDQLKNIGYLVSNREGGKGNEDVYKVEKERDNLVIKVMDQATGQPVPFATIDFSDCKSPDQQADENGIFNFQMLDDLDCSIVVKKQGYQSNQARISSTGKKQNRTLEIKLTNLQFAYEGKVVNGSNGYFLQDVRIIATDEGTGESTRTNSDSGGNYTISLKPGGSYNIRYSKPGFQDFGLMVQTSQNDRKTLRNVDLFPVGAPVSPTPPAVETSIPQPAEPPAKTTAKTARVSGFAIQIAAFDGSTDDLSNYIKQIGDLGTVYQVKEGGKTKIRLGWVSSREDAVELQKKVREKGYPGAFLVEEVNIELPMSYEDNAKELPKANSKEMGSVTDLTGVMVRLAAYTNLNYFNQDAVKDLGKVTFVPKGEYTIVLLRGYSAEADADIALKKAVSRGFKEAHLVEVVDGEIKKLK